jgi:3-phosphoshikimate 1-carboxyvinyltransferase
MIERVVPAASVLRGAVRVPGDKSASHRAVLISALADGESTVEGLSTGDDVSRTLSIVEALGATVSESGEKLLIVGPNDGLSATTHPLNCGNSGTAMRLLAGVLTGVPGQHELIGDDSLMSRPIGRVVEPLRRMGAEISASTEGLPPVRVNGSEGLKGIDYEVPTPSAQVKSAILFAGLKASGTTTVHERIRTRKTTEEMLAEALIDISSRDDGDGRVVTLEPGRPMRRHWQIPGDPSQAAFFAVLGLTHPNASIGVVKLLADDERTGFIRVLQRMGGLITFEKRVEASAIQVRSSRLHATEIYAAEIPSVDEVPAVAIAAAAATGVTAFRDMSELRIKESDRFAGSMMLASSVGCEVWSEADDFYVRGLGSATNFANFKLDGGMDHRIVMAAAVAATAGNGGTIKNWGTVESSYPRFFEDLSSIQ